MIVFLLLGAILNVAVAFVFARYVNLWRDVVWGPNTPNQEQRRWWSQHRPADAVEQPDGLNHAENFGAVQDNLYPDDESPDAVQVSRFRAGWPALGFEGEIWINDRKVILSKGLFGLPEKPWDPEAPIPYRPIWPGFAINTLFYAAILWLVFAAPFVLRRRRRIKRGRCPACGYPIGANDVCTECGRAVTPRQRAHAAQAVLPPGRAGD